MILIADCNGDKNNKIVVVLLQGYTLNKAIAEIFTNTVVVVRVNLIIIFSLKH